MAISTIRSRLIRSFSIAILIPSLVSTVVGVRVIQRQIYAQAQAQVNSDLEAASEIWRNHLGEAGDCDSDSCHPHGYIRRPGPE